MVDIRLIVGVVTNLVGVAILCRYGFKLLADYHSVGRWAKNLTSLLAGWGLLLLAAALLITPANAELIAFIAKTKMHLALLVLSSMLLVAAIATFGILTYWRPARLALERKIERQLQDELPRIP